MGYKVVLFLWNKDNLKIPIGFGFYHKDSASVSEITLNFIGRLRNELKIRPEIFVADGPHIEHLILSKLCVVWSLQEPEEPLKSETSIGLHNIIKKEFARKKRKNVHNFLQIS